MEHAECGKQRLRHAPDKISPVGLSGDANRTLLARSSNPPSPHLYAHVHTHTHAHIHISFNPTNAHWPSTAMPQSACHQLPLFFVYEITYSTGCSFQPSLPAQGPPTPKINELMFPDPDRDKWQIKGKHGTEYLRKVPSHHVPTQLLQCTFCKSLEVWGSVFLSGLSPILSFYLGSYSFLYSWPLFSQSTLADTYITRFQWCTVRMLEYCKEHAHSRDRFN